MIDLQRMHKKGIGTLISISSNLNKTELLQRLQSAEPAIETLHVYVHNTCRTELKNEASKIAKRRNSEENTGGEAKRSRQSSQRSGEQQFEWKCHCLICGNECADGHRSEAWSVCEKILKEKPEHTRDTWLKLLEGKIDEESLAAKCCLQSCSDLPVCARIN